MFRPSDSGFRQKLTGLTLKGALYGSWILGVFPFTYDSWTRKLHRSKWLIAYGLILNTALILLVVTNDTESETPLKMQVFHRNALAEQVNGIHDIQSLSMVSIMLLRGFWKSGDIEKLLNELQDLQHRHFRHFSFVEEGSHFDSFVMYKGLSIVLEILSMLILELGMSPFFSAQLFIGVTSLCLMILSVLLGASHFHLALAFVYRNVWTVNRELLRLVNKLANGETVKSERVDYLLNLYHRLFKLSNRLISVYDYQMVMVMASFLIANVLGIYFFIIYSISLKNNLDIKIVVFIQALVINMVDFWLNVEICDLTERTGRQTSTILKLFNDIENIEEKLERSISDFALYCSHRRLRFQHCGLFYVNYEMGFRMAITSFLYLLFLIQFDFWNL
ncbi:LOW QUALITY PROTEIN: gustatory receptor for bitter taste 22e [Drosophila eugracilis]|uniref:LOW QUALITY PROTEIN: gustatory receptor for bitter taste 22e n=1 Tax=Drosophila eugracilis TaxID=29029 RepID=UPI001BDAF354|nr:LOW QUALITY PROTEIN: gustatory receptor for bitter taste 22e [Drosophila eugracilis]